MVDATLAIVAEECRDAELADVGFVEQWLGHRNDTSALQALISRDYVVDTMEISAPWSRCHEIYEAATAAIRAVPGTLVASAHQSHSYPDGACLYFTFAGQPVPRSRETYYRNAWDAGTRAVLAHGGALSHHHGIGLNRSRFVPRRARARVRRAGRHQAGARSERHPQPRASSAFPIRGPAARRSGPTSSTEPRGHCDGPSRL